MRRYEQIRALKHDGLTNSEIADRLKIGANSVKIALLRYADTKRHEAYKATNRAQQARRREQEL
jgi:DNA-binding CsgD family transcriptional regulator